MKRWGRLVIAVVAPAAALTALWPVPTLIVTAGPPERVLWRETLTDPVELRLEYMHSVERTPVVEVYEAARRGLRLRRMEFAAAGAGLPSEGYVRVGDRFVLWTDRRLPQLPVRVSAGSRQRLLIGRSTTFELLAVAGKGGIVTVRVGAAPRLPFLRGMLY